MTATDYAATIHALWADFRKACRTFRYRDIMALSRSLGVHRRTIERWRYCEAMPEIPVALTVLGWVEQGKPMRKPIPIKRGRPPYIAVLDNAKLKHY